MKIEDGAEQRKEEELSNGRGEEAAEGQYLLSDKLIINQRHPDNRAQS